MCSHLISLTLKYDCMSHSLSTVLSFHINEWSTFIHPLLLGTKLLKSDEEQTQIYSDTKQDPMGTLLAAHSQYCRQIKQERSLIAIMLE